MPPTLFTLSILLLTSLVCWAQPTSSMQDRPANLERLEAWAANSRAEGDLEKRAAHDREIQWHQAIDYLILESLLNRDRVDIKGLKELDRAISRVKFLKRQFTESK